MDEAKTMGPVFITRRDGHAAICTPCASCAARIGPRIARHSRRGAHHGAGGAVAVVELDRVAEARHRPPLAAPAQQRLQLVLPGRWGVGVRVLVNP